MIKNITNQVSNYFKSIDFKKLMRELPGACSHAIHR